jgi:hypothetical protein
MYKHFEYKITSFTWHPEINTLIGNAKELWYEGYYYPFPNGKKQFFIKNNKTQGFRRFRYSHEVDTDIFFSSEDGINCCIKDFRIKIGQVNC